MCYQYQFKCKFTLRFQVLARLFTCWLGFTSLFLTPSLLSSLTVFLAFVFIQLVALTRNGWCNSFSTREIILYALWSWTRKAKNKAKNKRQAYKQQHLSRQEIDEANFIQRNKSYVIPRGISPRKLYLT